MQNEHLKSEGDLNLSQHRKNWQAKNISEETQYWLQEDAKYFLHQSLSTPCLNVLQHCQGPYIEDLAGRKFMDFHGNNVHHLGFSNPVIVNAVIQQIRELSFCTRRYTNIPAIQLAKRLTELTESKLSRVLFAPGGSLAVGMALKLARAATGRHKMISMWDSFHGASLDAISLGGESIFRSDIGPLLPGIEHVPPSNPSNCPFGCGERCDLKCADYVEYVLEKEQDVAAVVAETVRSTPFIPPPEYWQKIRKACDKHGALLILDEIPHGMGRTGKMFTYQHYGIEPDILVIGKSLGGGIFPLAAILANESLNVMKEKALGHYTHEKNPVACAAGLAMIDFITQNEILSHVQTMGDYFMQQLNELKVQTELVHSIRGKGLLIGVEIATSSDSIQNNDLAEQVMYTALELGLSFKISMGNILTLTPPLTIQKNELDCAVDILYKSLLAIKPE